jgi:hypothetical protein
MHNFELLDFSIPFSRGKRISIVPLSARLHAHASGWYMSAKGTGLAPCGHPAHI